MLNIVEGNRTAEVVTAYRNAMDILVEIANRDRYRAYAQPYIGFGGPGPYSTPYASGLVSTYRTPYANGMPNTYTTPYNNPGSTDYITPYSNPPVVAKTSGTSQSNAVIEPEAHAINHPSLENRTAQDSRDETKAEMITSGIEESTDGFKETTRDDDAISLSSALNIDNFLALANGGVPPGRNDDSNDSDHDDGNHIGNLTALDAPPSPADTIDQSLSRADEDIQALVDNIANDLMRSEGPPNQVPPGNPYAAFYSTMNGKQLGAELKRLVAVAQPEVNAIMPREQIQAAHLFYTHLVSRAHTRNAAIVRPAQVNQYANNVAPNQWGQASYPPPPPKGYMVQWHDSFTGAPTQPPPPMGRPFIRRGNVIAPPAVRNIEEERKVATYGFPPKPGRRPGLRSGGKKGRKKE